MEQVPPCFHQNDGKFSQCLSYSKLAKPVLDACRQADDAIDDFELLFQDNAISTLSEHNDTERNLLETSLDASLISNDSDRKAETPVNWPFAPFSVEEVSLVKTLSCWSNLNVRVIGNVSPNNEDSNEWNLESIGEEGGPFCIAVDMKLVKSLPPPHTSIQVFGEMQMVNNTYPVIIAKFFRDFSSVDIYYYQKALEEVKKYVPHFIDKKSQPSEMEPND